MEAEKNRPIVDVIYGHCKHISDEFMGLGSLWCWTQHDCSFCKCWWNSGQNIRESRSVKFKLMRQLEVKPEFLLFKYCSQAWPSDSKWYHPADDKVPIEMSYCEDMCGVLWIQHMATVKDKKLPTQCCLSWRFSFYYWIRLVFDVFW